MKVTARWRSGKSHRDENFPVASRLVAARHRPAILAFYRFARAADDAADHPTLPAAEKHRLLDALEATLFKQGDSADAVPLRDALASRRMTARHPCDLLRAFRMDVEKRRYADWNDLMDYCALSAMPVGRFVLDVHGESQRAWPASDALCAALQVINHLQDCGRDYRDLDRIYLPADALAEHGASETDFARATSCPELRRTTTGLAEKTDDLLRLGSRLTGEIADFRLRMEIDAIRRLAEKLVSRLKTHDPLSERVHLGKTAALVAMTGAAAAEAAGLLRKRRRTAAR